MNTQRALEYAERYLHRNESSRLDAELLLAHVLRRERAVVLAHPEVRLPLLTNLRFRWLMWQRKRGVPLAYLRGRQAFYGRDFIVTRQTLIPRPDTEVVVERALALAREHQIQTIIDVGTGSGCIGLTLAAELPTLRVFATDTSQRALVVARRNANIHGVTERVRFCHGNLLEPFLLPTSYSLLPNTLVVANLPYLRPGEISRELRFEPRQALVGGSDGLAYYRALLKQLTTVPTAQCPRWLVLEVHAPLVIELQAIIKNIFPKSQAQLTHDLASLPRVLSIKLA